LELDSSVSGNAKQELILFHKINRTRSKKMRYKPLEALAASCILVVCRLQKIGRTEKEVLAVCMCTKRHLAIVLRGVNRAIVEMCNRHVPVSNTKDVIQRFCANLNVSALVVSTATQIVQEIDKRGVCQSRLISSVAGAAIFMACIVCNTHTSTDAALLLKEVSAVSGAADATIREVCKKLHVYSKRILPVRYHGADISVLLKNE
jgi:transcription initiation factor TFIIIB Brf1 subunit/transcription initiation factor TFIIB